jgi:hypothetical protein
MNGLAVTARTTADPSLRFRMTLLVGDVKRSNRRGSGNYFPVSPILRRSGEGAYRPQFFQSRIYTGRVKLQLLMIALVTGVLSNGPVAHSADTKVEQTTVCNIVNHPSDFIGKTIEIRAQIWADHRYREFFWMNESSAPVAKVCRFLQASFTHESDLSGQTAFGTFRGRIVKKLSRQTSTLLGPEPKGLGIILLVDQASDIHLRRDYLSGPIPILQLYDQQTAAFVRPED